MATSLPNAAAPTPERSGRRLEAAQSGQGNGSRGPAGKELLASTEQRLRVLIADHDGLARWMMHTALHEGDRSASVHFAGDAREALQLARYYRPTVAIIDTALPPDGAVDLIAKILALTPETRILTVSVDDQQTAIAALRAGAVGHIGKDV